MLNLFSLMPVAEFTAVLATVMALAGGLYRTRHIFRVSADLSETISMQAPDRRDELRRALERMSAAKTPTDRRSAIETAELILTKDIVPQLSKNEHAEATAALSQRSLVARESYIRHVLELGLLRDRGSKRVREPKREPDWPYNVTVQ